MRNFEEIKNQCVFRYVNMKPVARLNFFRFNYKTESLLSHLY